MPRTMLPWTARISLALCLVLSAPALSADGADGGSSMPDDATLEARGVTIGAIEIDAEDVFDPEKPGEDRRLFRAANRLHRETRQAVIARQLLFKTGDRFSRRVLDETERLLRTDRYLYDVSIRVARLHGETVDLVVETRDVWTLKVGLGLGRSGGANTSRFELQDTNLLGLGKALTLSRENGVDRSTTELRYDDRNLLGSRAELSLSAAETSDGSRRYFRLARPFYSLATRWGAELAAFDEERVDSFYQLGEITGRIGHRLRSFELSGGLSRGLIAGRTHRFSLGFTYREDRFTSVAGAGAVALPPDRTLAYPWVSFDRLEDRFIEEHDLDRLHRTEDLALGTQLHARLGLASSLTGSDRTALIFDASAATGRRPSARQTLSLEGRVTGRYGTAGVENLLLSSAARYHLRDFGNQLFYIDLEASATENRDPENQLLLGGDSGLRGYPLRYQDGDRRLLLTVEQRFFTHLEPWHLFHVGAAAFVDTGRTWGREDHFGRNLGWLADAGLGLRLAPSRSHNGSVVHVDVAFPLLGPRDLEHVQLLVTTKTSF